MAARPFMRIAIHGIAQTRAKLRELRREEDRVIALEVKRALVNIERGAKLAAPVKTGNLRKRIAHELTPNKLGGRSGTNVHYAPHVHFGTRRMRGRPFLYGPFRAEHPVFKQRLAEALTAAHRRVCRR